MRHPESRLVFTPEQHPARNRYDPRNRRHDHELSEGERSEKGSDTEYEHRPDANTGELQRENESRRGLISTIESFDDGLRNGTLAVGSAARTLRQELVEQGVEVVNTNLAL